MSQSDYVVSNGTGAAVRSDINGQLAAIVTQNSGATEPTTTYAYMRWADTTAGVMKMRNGANSAWITLYQLDGEWSTIAFENGTAAAPSIYFKDSGTDTGFYSPGANQVGISTGGTAALVIDSSQRVGLGTSSPSYLLHLNGTSNVESRAITSGASSTAQWGAQNTTGATVVMGAGGSSYTPYGAIGASNAYLYTGSDLAIATDGANVIKFATGAGIPERMRIDSSGRVGIGDNAPGVRLSVLNGTDNSDVAVFSGGDRTRGLKITTGAAGGNNDALVQLNAQNSAGQFAVLVNGSEAYRVDNSKRLLVGTSSARTYSTGGSGGNQKLQVETAGATSVFTTAGIYSNSDVAAIGAYLELGRSKGTALGSVTAVANDDLLGEIRFAGTNGSSSNNAASIAGYVDGTVSGGGANDMPGRLVFSTTADGASSPTERMRIRNNGTISMGPSASSSTTPNDASGAGYGSTWVLNSGVLDCAVSNSAVGFFNRCQSDGDIISFKQDATTEGTISVSGTTVSYNGAHLSRWSQLPGGAVREEILRGTVLSNIDEMCAWGEEENEQLNRMKVSDVEGDPNVSGVFQAWDDDDDTYTDDFYCAMTGDFIIRIAEGVTVQRGDLLMSAGDGTAKPQDDDIIRSKTVAKVTSTHVTCTYDDGSYCVPCVLMAC